MPTTTVSELKAFHATDRDMYRRLVDDTKQDPSSAMHIMALWLVLETINFEGTGYADLVQKAASYDNNALSLLEIKLPLRWYFAKPEIPARAYFNDIREADFYLGFHSKFLEFCQNWKNTCRKVFDYDEVPVCRTESLNEEVKSRNLEATTPIDEARTQPVDSTGYSNEEWVPLAMTGMEQAEPIQDVIFEDEESMARHLLGDLLMYL
ncbi:hypothetical protein AMTR_s00006p00265780 [Amborella trichopoda]|uniref:Uncharacterized protein n=1 Tax=Amborella trichopoda TaxID=13333 RepID=W1PD53_AMBTC|nr:hypothetical protein AMTR_s00006p00265780 [Amborella trichopoda]